MPRPQHTLAAVKDTETAAVTCDECDYAFIATVDESGIALTDRIWLDRGDRSVTHAYMTAVDH